jgi:hypothetical protein
MSYFLAKPGPTSHHGTTKDVREQAEQVFHERFPDGRFLRGYVSYTSYYNTAMGICFVEMSTSRLGGGPKAVWPFSKSIDDAFGGKSYGCFQEITDKGEDRPRRTIAGCNIDLPGQETMACKSEQEFDALALKYFGIAP